jgi:multicomponent Na+:H+ antiporter subunit F
MTIFTIVSYSALLTAGTLCLIRLVRGGSSADRIVAVDALLVVVISGLAVYAGTTGDGTYLGLLVVAGLLGFVGSALLTTLLRRR